jgi:hypothetical protein
MMMAHSTASHWIVPNNLTHTDTHKKLILDERQGEENPTSSAAPMKWLFNFSGAAGVTWFQN